MRIGMLGRALENLETSRVRTRQILPVEGKLRPAVPGAYCGFERTIDRTSR
jgi:hypothetical protein